MNPIQTAAFQLDMKSLKALKPTQENIRGALLAACSAHNPKKANQTKVLAYLLESGADPRIKNKMGKRAADYVKDEGIRKLLQGK